MGGRFLSDAYVRPVSTTTVKTLSVRFIFAAVDGSWLSLPVEGCGMDPLGIVRPPASGLWLLSYRDQQSRLPELVINSDLGGQTVTESQEDKNE